MNEATPFNPAAIERLVKLGGPKFALEMIGLFGSYGGQKIAEALKAEQAKNLPALAAAVHPLKSSAGNVGAVRVQELASQLEQAATQQEVEKTVSLMQDLETAFAVAVKFLETEKAKLTSSPA